MKLSPFIPHAARRLFLSVLSTAFNVISAFMAASLVLWTRFINLGYRKKIATPVPIVVVGGGARSHAISLRDLEGALPPPGEVLDLRCPEYGLQAYVPLNDITLPEVRPEGAVVCRLPTPLVCSKLDVGELRELAKLHGLRVTKLHVRAALIQMLCDHECGDKCPALYALLLPVVLAAPASAGLLDVCSEDFAAAVRTISLNDLRVFLTPDQQNTTRVGFSVKEVSRTPPPLVECDRIVLQDIPLPILAQNLTVSGLRALASHHGLNLPSRWRKERCVDTLRNHRCTGCVPLHFVLEPVCPKKKAKPGKGSWLDDNPEPFLWQSFVEIPTEVYPPRPTTMRDVAVAMRAYCSELTPEKVVEAGCAVCGTLHVRAEMKVFDPSAYDLDVLKEESATRRERFSPQDPVCHRKGPVLVPGAKTICEQCHESLCKSRRPKMALANHLWVGETPSCLKDLTLGECALISRVRYNQCVVRVSQGHAKMVANVIAFEHPSKKIYERLPMGRHELSEVLSIVYTGIEPPSDDDLKRTPVLVRRDKVRAALEWLKLNHKDYEDLTIDYEVLETYALESVPIGLLRKEVLPEGGNILAAAKSVFDNTFEEGTTDGMCPYSVSGLTAERHGSMTTSQRKWAGLQYLKNGGTSLAVGHDMSPQSIWNNPSLYPKMFPWLFPYGMGGIGQDVHENKIGDKTHLRALLAYHDKRFQRDAGFLIVLMNHNLIKQSSRGSFISMRRGNFSKAAAAIDNLDPVVLNLVGERLKNGGKFIPRTPEERRCATLMDQVDVIGNHVDGSLAKKKSQRGEIWSLINFHNAPNWFITLSPVDSKHPLCIHWASSDEEFKPEIKGYKERQHLITRNPVACAKFFHHIVTIFIKHLCGWSEDEVKRGIFGVPEAFYGTVEEQGRKTLHLHFLLWIRNQMPLHVVREKLMSADSEFMRELTDYVESCMIGEFLTGSKDEVAARVPIIPEHEDRGIHTILSDDTKIPDGYVDPTLTLPEMPPPVACEDPDQCRCSLCIPVLSWWERFKTRFDDILVRSNVHTCFARKTTKKKEGSEDEDGASKKKQRTHATAKGCLDKNGVCRARFPREVFMHTTVDTETGHMNVRKRESALNDVTPALTYAHGCNTDTRFLLSGTSVKAVVGYVTDYISKAWLKTHQIFEAAYNCFDRNADLLDRSGDEVDKNNARRMIMKVVNSLSSQMEMGAPMAAMYLLGNPDHYTSHKFVPFYWKNYMNYVEGEWEALRDFADEGDSAPDVDEVGVTRGHKSEDDDQSSAGPGGADELDIGWDADGNAIGPTVLDNHGGDIVVLETGHIADDVRADVPDTENNSYEEGEETDTFPITTAVQGGDKAERVVLMRARGRYLAKSNTDDYRFRPHQLEGVCLYDFVQCAVKASLHSERSPQPDLRWFSFTDDHPQVHTMAVAMDADRARLFVPNFIGPALPRKDVGEREVYCCAMLTLFMPWRTGIDMKSMDVSWEATFDAYPFTERQRTLMANFNMRYECYDARDDYGALIKAAGKLNLNNGGDDDVDSDCDSVYADNGENEEDSDDLSGPIGKDTIVNETANAEMVRALRRAGWATGDPGSAEAMNLPRITLDASLRSNAWNNIVNVEKMRAWRRKMSGMSDEPPVDADRTNRPVVNDAFLVNSTYLSKAFKPPAGGWEKVIDSTVAEFELNPGQEKAFRIIANHACLIAPTQLLMHLGGMGGTGKSTVIKALSTFFAARDENHRFVLLGPTGTSAALIGGSTYHTFLGVNTTWAKANTGSKLEGVRERLHGVGYILLDEHSMLDCRALCAISARCCEALGCYEKPFGGLNVILSGDFAQLPPVKGSSLYSRNVTLHQTARQTVAQQEATIGKHIWLQFTTVVILTQNMRQTATDADEMAFRTALENLRWHACTDADIALLRKRLAGSSEDLSVDAAGYKNVSIITAKNRDKDQINASCSARFAQEAGMDLVHFYSSDTLKPVDPAKKTWSAVKRIYSTVNKMTKSLQINLWNQAPCTSEQIPGKLSLCQGMPIMIRYNDATDLCMTRGQEGRVVGWTAMKMPKWDGRLHLDTLYVQLLNPPRRVKLPHLPVNVVPLTRNTETVQAQLPNDQWVSVARTQVSVLPNFAMTDYSAQGKTREWNVVDISRCKSFQGAYTCLSRGTSLKRTLIVRDFPEDLLRGKLDGGLRQEYRELDYLSTITDLVYEGIVPCAILRPTRWETISSYRLWKNTVGASTPNAPAIPVHPDEKDHPEEEVGHQHETLSAKLMRKRKATTTLRQPPAKKPKFTMPGLANIAWASPAGPVWDSTDWSCAYDALTFIFHGVWCTDKVKWSRLMKGRSNALRVMIEGVESMANRDPEMELSAVRDKWRACVRSDAPEFYPRGRVGVDIMTLVRQVLNYTYRGGVVSTKCEACENVQTHNSSCGGTLGVFVSVRQADTVQEFVSRSWETRQVCGLCGGNVVVEHCYSDIIVMEVYEAGQLGYNDRLQIPTWGLYRLAGVVYFGHSHFVARVVTPDNKVYIHDGMEGSHATFEGVLNESFQPADLGTSDDKRASLLVYVLADRPRHR